MAEVAPRCVLYSLEHGAFWARPGVGYTPVLALATRYDEGSARRISDESKVHWKPEQGYASAPDIVVPLPFTERPEWVADECGQLERLVKAQVPEWPFPVADNRRRVPRGRPPYVPITEYQLGVAEGFASKCTDGDVRDLIRDLVKEIRDSRAAAPAGGLQVQQLDVQELQVLDPVLWVCLKALERGALGLGQQDVAVPAVIGDLVAVLQALVDQSEIAQGRPY